MPKLPPLFNESEIGKHRREKIKQTLHEAMTGPRVVGKIVKEGYKSLTNRHDGHKEAHHESHHKRSS